MADQTLKFEGNADEIIKAYEKMAAAQDKQIAKMKQAVDVSKDGHSEVMKGFNAQVTQLASLAAGYVGIGAAVGAITGAYREWHQEILALGRDHSKFSADLLRTLAESSDLKQGGQIETFLQTLPGKSGATPEQGRVAFQAIREASPSLDLQRREALTEQVTRAAPLGVDLAQVGGTVGEFAELMGPGASAKDVMDKSMRARGLAGGNASKLTDPGVLRMMSEMKSINGTSDNEAMATVIQAMDDNAKMKKLEGEILKGKKFDPTLGGLISAEGIADKTRALEGSSGFTDEQLAAARETVSGRSVATRQGIAARGALAKSLEGLQGSQEVDREEALKDLQRQYDMNFAGRWIGRGNLQTAELFGEGAGQTELARQSSELFGADSEQTAVIRELVKEQQQTRAVLERQLELANDQASNNKHPTVVSDPNER